MKVSEQALYLAAIKRFIQKIAKDKPKYWFEKFEVDKWWNKKIEDLSKGWLKRFNLLPLYYTILKSLF